ncbi:hypothetical protein SORBI_3003G160466 [Sorghum bicolor]|uniref:Uncharacterized protein n=1 Tax=Sorghum bicolor TaxID=4558 RepID=A0A1W0VXH5_SORBI|nr:hypothetical protein SORBI_3003G160466 [Sorghum bicolor]
MTLSGLLLTKIPDLFIGPLLCRFGTISLPIQPINYMQATLPFGHHHGNQNMGSSAPINYFLPPSGTDH